MRQLHCIISTYEEKLTCISSSIHLICLLDQNAGSREYLILTLTSASCALFFPFSQISPILSTFACCIVLFVALSFPSPKSSSHPPRSPKTDWPHLRRSDWHNHQSPLVAARHHCHYGVQDHSRCSWWEHSHFWRHGHAYHWPVHGVWTGTWNRLRH